LRKEGAKKPLTFEPLNVVVRVGGEAALEAREVRIIVAVVRLLPSLYLKEASSISISLSLSLSLSLSHSLSLSRKRFKKDEDRSYLVERGNAYIYAPFVEQSFLQGKGRGGEVNAAGSERGLTEGDPPGI